MLVLALSDAVVISMWAAGLIVNAVMAVVVIRLNRIVRKGERSEDRFQEALRDAQAELKAEAARNELSMRAAAARQHETDMKLIDERMRGITHQVADNAHGVSLSLESLDRKVVDTEKRIARLSEVDFETLMAGNAQVNAVRDMIRKEFPTKEDVQRNQDDVREQLGAVTESIVELRVAVGKLAEKVGAA